MCIFYSDLEGRQKSTNIGLEMGGDNWKEHSFVINNAREAIIGK